MYIGIDLGTSGVKVILLNEQGEVVASQTEKLTVSRPHPLWSEQDPEQWWQATDRAMKALGDQHSLQDVKALGIASKMHGATLLDAQQRVLRPAILWNDGRCAQECTLLEARVPQSRVITGNLMMPGFTAPKLLWVQRHEPEIFRQIDKVLLPKDYLRLRMTGSLPAICLTQLAPCGWMSQSVTGVTSCCRLATYLVTRCPHYTKAAKLLVLCYLKLRKRGVWRRCQLSQAVATMQLVQLVWEWLMLIRQCYRWGRRGSILLSAKGS